MSDIEAVECTRVHRKTAFLCAAVFLLPCLVANATVDGMNAPGFTRDWVAVALSKGRPGNPYRDKQGRFCSRENAYIHIGYDDGSIRRVSEGEITDEPVSRDVLEGIAERESGETADIARRMLEEGKPSEAREEEAFPSDIAGLLDIMRQARDKGNVDRGDKAERQASLRRTDKIGSKFSIFGNVSETLKLTLGMADRRLDIEEPFQAYRALLYVLGPQFCGRAVDQFRGYERRIGIKVAKGELKGMDTVNSTMNALVNSALVDLPRSWKILSAAAAYEDSANTNGADGAAFEVAANLFDGCAAPKDLVTAEMLARSAVGNAHFTDPAEQPATVGAVIAVAASYTLPKADIRYNEERIAAMPSAYGKAYEALVDVFKKLSSLSEGSICHASDDAIGAAKDTARKTLRKYLKGLPSDEVATHADYIVEKVRTGYAVRDVVSKAVVSAHDAMTSRPEKWEPPEGQRVYKTTYMPDADSVLSVRSWENRLSEGLYQIASVKGIVGPIQNANTCFMAKDEDDHFIGVCKDNSGLGKAKYESAAYAVDTFFGFNIVPPTFDIGANMSLQGSVLDAPASDADESEEVWAKGVGFAKDYVVQPKCEWTHRMFAFDYIMGNIDRHMRNVMTTPNGRLFAIDNGGIEMGHYNPGKAFYDYSGGMGRALKFRGSLAGKEVSEKTLDLLDGADEGKFKRMLFREGFGARQAEACAKRLRDLRTRRRFPVNGIYG